MIKSNLTLMHRVTLPLFLVKLISIDKLLMLTYKEFKVNTG